MNIYGLRFSISEVNFGYEVYEISYELVFSDKKSLFPSLSPLISYLMPTPSSTFIIIFYFLYPDFLVSTIHYLPILHLSYYFWNFVFGAGQVRGWYFKYYLGSWMGMRNPPLLEFGMGME